MRCESTIVGFDSWLVNGHDDGGAIIGEFFENLHHIEKVEEESRPDVGSSRNSRSGSVSSSRAILTFYVDLQRFLEPFSANDVALNMCKTHFGEKVLYNQLYFCWEDRMGAFSLAA